MIWVVFHTALTILSAWLLVDAVNASDAAAIAFSGLSLFANGICIGQELTDHEKQQGA